MTRAQELVKGMLVVLTAMALATPSARGQCSTPSQLAKLIASDAAASDYFGTSVSISGDTAVIGARADDDRGSASGSAYVFHRAGAAWQQVAKLTAADGTASDNFGISVSISGDTVIVGANHDDDAGISSGSAYVFREFGGIWQQIAKLTALVGNPGDQFGISVSISGDTAVIGAYLDEDAGSASGAAYVFREVEGVWQLIAKLSAPDTAAGDNFGLGVSVSGNTAVIGARFEDEAATDSGSAYVFREVGGLWQQIAKLTASDAAANAQFGVSVSLSGDTAVIGAIFANGTGSAYVFREVGSVWQQIVKLTASDAAVGDQFGNSVSLSGDTAVIGAYLDSDAGSGSGSASVFREIDGVWQQFAKLTASDAAAADQFGVSVSASGDTTVIGARFEDAAGSDSGSAYIFGGVSCDADGDGVLDPDDICPNNAPGLPVSCKGRPLRDCNEDCLYNTADIQCLVDEMLNN